MFFKQRVIKWYNFFIWIQANKGNELNKLFLKCLQKKPHASIMEIKKIKQNNKIFLNGSFFSLCIFIPLPGTSIRVFIACSIRQPNTHVMEGTAWDDGLHDDIQTAVLKIPRPPPSTFKTSKSMFHHHSASTDSGIQLLVSNTQCSIVPLRGDNEWVVSANIGTVSKELKFSHRLPPIFKKGYVYQR